MFYQAWYVCLSVRYQLHIKTADGIFMQVLPEMCLRTAKTPLNFERHPLLDRDVEGFFRIYQH